MEPHHEDGPRTQSGAVQRDESRPSGLPEQCAQPRLTCRTTLSGIVVSGLRIRVRRELMRNGRPITTVSRRILIPRPRQPIAWCSSPPPQPLRDSRGESAAAPSFGSSGRPDAAWQRDLVEEFRRKGYLVRALAPCADSLKKRASRA